MPTSTFLRWLCVGAALIQPGHGCHIAMPQVFLDFDGTISPNQTILIFAGAIYAATPPDMVTLPPLENLLAQYEANITIASQAFGKRSTIRQEAAFESSSLRRDVDLNLFNSVKSSGMVDYLNLTILEEAAKSVTIEEDFWEFASKLIQRDQVPTILSDSFSVQWIRTVLRLHYNDFRSRSMNKTLPHDLADRIRIYSSEILPKQISPPSPFDHPTAIHCGGDKAEVIVSLVGGSYAAVLYAGDGLEDVPPILESGVGILMNSDADVTQTLEKDGARLEELDSSHFQYRAKSRPVIFTTEGFKVLSSVFSKLYDA